MKRYDISLTVSAERVKGLTSEDAKENLIRAFLEGEPLVAVKWVISESDEDLDARG